MSLSLADALSRVDIRAYYESHGCIVSGKPTHSREGYEWSCSCCLCGGVDRASFWSSGRFCCVRGCHAHCSSVYWFARDILNMTHLEALADLCIDASEIDDFSGTPKVKLPLFLTSEDEPCKTWQDSASAFCQMTEKCLWTSKGASALNYLRARGFKDELIKQARLGFCPDWYKAPLEQWGLSAEQLNREDDPQIKIPTGIVIPYRINDSLWKIQLRRPAPGPDGKKYKSILGSAECLYTLQSIEAGRPLMLVESELDALSVYQEASDLLTCIATSSAAKGLTSRNIARFSRASVILQSFDQDEAGNKDADEWLSKYTKEKARRWKPWAHDVNDMLKSGLPVRLWVESGLQTMQATIQVVPPALVALEEEQAQALLQEFKAVNGELYLRDDGVWRIVVPEWWSDRLYQEWKERIFALHAPLTRLVEQRDAKKERAA